jgi:signal transduction histidine kinase
VSLKNSISFCFSLFFLTASSQGLITDSLELKLKSSTGTQKVDILNRLTYEFISVDNNKVVLYSNEALQLSKTLKYVKGEGIAYTYRGVYEYSSGKFPEAHTNLHQGLQLSKIVKDRTNIGYALLQLGNCSLEEVEMDSAHFYLMKALTVFKDSVNPEMLAKAYRNLSALYGQLSQRDSQQLYLAKSIAIRKLLPDKHQLVDALLLQAKHKIESGDISGAEVLLSESENIVKDIPGAVENQHDVQHLRALAFFHQGRFDEGIVLVDSARSYYLKTSLLRKYVTLLIDLGKTFSDRGEYELALNNLYDGLRISRLRGFEAETYTIRNLIGWVNFHLGDRTQALRMANETLRPGKKKILRSDLANALTLKGVSLTDLNEFTTAKGCLDSAFQIYKQMGNVERMSEALLNLGELESRLNHPAKAHSLYSESILLAKSVNYTYGLAWSNWATGDIFFRQGNYQNATRYLNESEKYCRVIKANEILIRNYNTRRDLLAAQGLYKESLRYSIMASRLNDSIHRTDLTRRFVNLEKIEEIEQRDRNIKVLQQDRQLAEDKIQLQNSRIRQQFILIVAGAVGLALLTSLVFVYYRFYTRIKLLNVSITDKNTRIEAQALKLQEVNSELSELYEKVSRQKEEIQSQADKLFESNKSISDLNRNLEKIVAEKTVELRSANDELVKYNNELLQFSYTVSHNLRGPVARILGLSEIMLNETELAQGKHWTGLISKTSRELDLVIKDLAKILELRNELHQYRELVNLQQEWNQSLSLLQENLLGDEEIKSDFSSLPQIGTVRSMLQSIFYNLLSNALKFRSPDRKLKITAISRLADDHIIIEITDNGLGFNVNLYKDKLFKLYKRFHSHVEGRGLGLYLIKSQVDVLNGQVEVESKLDEGTVFRVILPILSEELLQARIIA